MDLATPAFYEWPLDRYIGMVWRRGELPLWNPHQGTGMPVVGNYSTRVFFPFQVLLDLSPIGLWDFFFLLRLWIAGVFTALFLARAGTGWTAATFGGIAYMLSGALVWFINLEQYANVAMVAPIWFLAIEVFVSSPGGRGTAWIALTVGSILLAGQPEIALYILVVGGLYGIVRWMSRPRTRHSPRAFAWGVSGVALGFVLAAAQLLPFASHLPNSLHLHAATAGMGVRDPAPGFLAIQIFVPSFYELPTPARILPDNGRWDLLGGYAGVLTVFLCAAGLVVPSWRTQPAMRPPLIFFGSVAAWLILKNFGIPPFDWIGHLPLFNLVWTPRWGGPTWCLALAAASAFGLRRLQETEVTRSVRARIALVSAAVLLLVGVLAGPGLAMLIPLQDAFWQFIWPGTFGGLLLACVVVGLSSIALARSSGVALGLALVSLLLIERWTPIPRGYSPLFLALRFLPVIVGLTAVTMVILGRRAVSGGLAALAIGLGLALDPIAPIGPPHRADPAAVPPAVEFLRERAGYDRIAGDRAVLAPNYAGALGLYDIRHVDALAVEWFHSYVTTALETQPRRWWHTLWFIGDPDRGASRSPGRSTGVTPLEEDLRARLRGYSLAGVRYIVARRGMNLNAAAATEADRFPLVYDREILVYENPAAFPRAFTVARWESAPDAAAARARALAGNFDPRTSAVVEGSYAGVGHPGALKITEYGASQLRLSVVMEGPGLVVLTDTFYPGWKASVDGRGTRIYRVDGVFRGVFVEGGRHEIAMRFRPASQFWGLGLSIAGLVTVSGLLAGTRPRSSSRARGEGEPLDRVPFSPGSDAVR